MIYLFTGQPGSGKTSIGKLLINFLSKDKKTIQIDGDDLRTIFNNADYSENGRKKNIERAHDIAYFLNEKDFDIVLTMVSPYRELRDRLKSKAKILEIYVYTSEIRGRESFFVENYEKPIENFIEIDTTNKIDIESFDLLITKINFSK